MATFEHYALVIPAGFYQLTFQHTVVAVPDNVLVTMGFGGSGYTLTQADLDAIAGVWASTVVDDFSDQITFEKVYARDAGGVVLESFDGTVGGESGALGPVSNAVLVEKRTGVSGRRNRGRMYLPTCFEAETAWDGKINSTYQASWQVNMDAFLAAMNAVDGLASCHVLHSKGWNGGTEPADPGNAPVPTEITSLQVKQLIGTQRRRIR